MVSIRIKGGKKISGEVLVSGAKNASMPIIIASVLTEKPVTLSNVPFVKDVTTLISLLMGVGMNVTMMGDGRLEKTIKFQTPSLNFGSKIGLEAGKIRTSVLLIGPGLARNGYVKLLKPGGCNIGERKIDFHIMGMKALGAEVLETEECIELTTNGKRLKGAVFTFPSVSVGATENLLMAAILAEGKTVLKNAAVEPEIEDLIAFLNKIGGKITKTGEREFTIEGVQNLSGGEHIVIPDRMEALTYAMIACVTKGEILLKNVSIKDLGGGVEMLERAGIEFRDEPSAYQFGSVHCKLKNGKINALEAQTEAYPGFATDLQPQLSVLMLLAEGGSSITENIFENRFQHVSHLIRMGAKIELEGRKIIVHPSPILTGEVVEGTDLRACAALIMAGMIAKGETTLIHAESLDRGYYRFVKNIANCGGEIERIE